MARKLKPEVETAFAFGAAATPAIFERPCGPSPRELLETSSDSAKIESMTKGSELSDTEKVQRISALLANNHTAESLDPCQINELKAAMITELSEDDYQPIRAARPISPRRDAAETTEICRD